MGWGESANSRVEVAARDERGGVSTGRAEASHRNSSFGEHIYVFDERGSKIGELTHGDGGVCIPTADLA